MPSIESAALERSREARGSSLELERGSYQEGRRGGAAEEEAEEERRREVVH